jgi:polyisoprenoid-binding protein YceI
MKATYKIDPVHSSAQFVVRHMMITNVRGGFKGVTGTVEYDPDNVESTKIDATVEVAGISTLDADRDTHLKSPDFLHAEQHPTIAFKSKRVESAGDGELKVAGDLTIHGVTKEVVLNVEGPTAEGKDPWGNSRMGASATTKIKRSDFGLNWNAALETGGILVGDHLKIELDVSLIKEQAAAAA